jgi:hypothetical protein
MQIIIDTWIIILETEEPFNCQGSVFKISKIVNEKLAETALIIAEPEMKAINAGDLRPVNDLFCKRPCAFPKDNVHGRSFSVTIFRGRITWAAATGIIRNGYFAIQ